MNPSESRHVNTPKTLMCNIYTISQTRLCGLELCRYNRVLFFWRNDPGFHETTTRFPKGVPSPVEAPIDDGRASVVYPFFFISSEDCLISHIVPFTSCSLQLSIIHEMYILSFSFLVVFFNTQCAGVFCMPSSGFKDTNRLKSKHRKPME